MAKPTFLVFPSPLAKNDARLGRFVTDCRAPHDSYSTDNPTLPDKPTVKIDKNFFHNLKGNDDLTVHGKLTQFFHALFSTSSVSKAQLSAKEVETQIIHNPDSILRNLLDHEETKEWVEARKDRRLYVITGIKIAKDANVQFVEKKGRTTSVEVKLPLTAAVTSTPSTALDPSVGLSTVQGGYHDSRFDASGERIIAVQYHQLKYRLRQLRIEHPPISWNRGRGVQYDGGFMEPSRHVFERLSELPEPREASVSDGQYRIQNEKEVVVGPEMEEGCYGGNELENVEQVEMMEENLLFV